MKTIVLFFMIYIISFSNAFAHGEDKPGPHGGFIKMPGTFHTELLPDNDGNFLVYLVDLQNQAPTVKDSTVSLKIKNATTEVPLDCMKMDDHFHCVSNTKVTITKESKVVILATRLGVRAPKIAYDLPLKLKAQEHDMSKMKK